MSSSKRVLCALLAVGVFVALKPLAAMAQTDGEPPIRGGAVVSDKAPGDSFERAKAHVIRQTERRLTALDRLTGKIDNARHITEDHAAPLLRDVAAAREALRSGLAAVGATTTPEELREVAPPIFQDTLVFALLRPKTHEVIASDTVTAIGERLTEFGAKLQDALDRISGETDIDTTQAQSDLDEMIGLVNAATATGGPVAGNVISLQAADWPDPAQAALREGKAALGEARSSLHEARGLAKVVVRFIRSARS